MDVKIMSKRQQEFNGDTYWKCGVYFQRYGKRLHRIVWEFHNGEIPKDHEIHHLDFDHTNNSIENLVCIPESVHASLHVKRNLESGAIGEVSEACRQAAAEWHGSGEGKDWHKQHYENTKHLLHRKVLRKCTVCDTEHETVRLSSENTFCSNNCKSKFRRASGKDNITKECVVCGTEFISSRYNKTITCSRVCSGKSQSNTKLNK